MVPPRLPSVFQCTLGRTPSSLRLAQSRLAAASFRWQRRERKRVCLSVALPMCIVFISNPPVVARGRIGGAGSMERRAYSLDSATR